MSNLTPHDRETLDGYKSLSVGQILTKARKSQSLNLQQIAAHLNIGLAHLEAIEQDNMKALPPKVYSVGFVRAYSDLLGLDAEKMAYLFKVQTYGKKQTDQHKEALKADGKTVSLVDAVTQNIGLLIRGLIGLAVFAVILVVGVIAYFWFFGENPNAQITNIPPVPEEIMEAAQEGEAAPLLPTEQNPDSAASLPLSEPMDVIIKPEQGAIAYGGNPLESPLAFKLRDGTTMEVRDARDGRVILSETLNKGDVFYVAEDQDILVTASDAGAIMAYLDNQLIGVLGQKGEAIRLRPFSVKALRLQ